MQIERLKFLLSSVLSEGWITIGVSRWITAAGKTAISHSLFSTDSKASSILS